MATVNMYENTAWLYDYDNRDNLKDDIPFYMEYAKAGMEVLHNSTLQGISSINRR